MFAGDPDAWAVAPDSPLPPFEDDIGATLDRRRPLSSACSLAALLARSPGSPGAARASGWRGWLRDGGLLGAELVRVQGAIRAVRRAAPRASGVKFTDERLPGRRGRWKAQSRVLLDVTTLSPLRDLPSGRPGACCVLYADESAAGGVLRGRRTASVPGYRPGRSSWSGIARHFPAAFAPRRRQPAARNRIGK